LTWRSAHLTPSETVWKSSATGKAGARVHEALVVALGEAISEVSEEDAKAFFEHCGYREAVQLL
jgi:hypothetical protein